ncbi:hypothetical protein EVJ58_g11166 [Rhodofomes roseus]|uniref:Uncharacterized protein n=1 Tax=Rhodofomes roseus TaxID=34475 RepID=A0A4Y9XJI5_9APHY|nr:hypothetical protein EVJ58_g11166 [Rhodofomes roseus]
MAVLRMDTHQTYDVTTFVNAYPTLDVNYELAKGNYSVSNAHPHQGLA